MLLIDYNINFLSLLLFNCGLFLASLGGGQLLIRKKNPGNYLLMVLFFFVSIRLIILSLHHGGIIDCPSLVLQSSFLVVKAGAGPVIYFLSKFYLVPNGFTLKQFIAHIVFTLSGSLLFLLVYKMMVHGSGGRMDYHAFFVLMLQLIISIYYVMNMKMIDSLYREVICHKKSFFLPLIILFGISFLNHLVSSFYRNGFISEVSFFTVIDCLVILAVYLLSRRNIGYLFFPARAPRQWDRRTYLKGIDEGKIIERIDRIMIQEKAYLQKDLTLGMLAKKIGITIHQLSEIINRHLDTSFYELINSYRIKEACDQLRYNKNSSIQSIAESAGYNSLSAFYNAFKKNTGYTPVEFRMRF